MRVVITGASSGIGEALAKHYAARGATLCLMARRQPELERLSGVLPGLTFCYPLDVTDAEAGEYVLRLRVDGADSIPVDFSTVPPQFDTAQMITITP